MGFFRSTTRVVQAASSEGHTLGIDLDRFERLLEMSVRLRDLGIDHGTIERRAQADGVSWNDALEAIDRERRHG